MCVQVLQISAQITQKENLIQSMAKEAMTLKRDLKQARSDTKTLKVDLEASEAKSSAAKQVRPFPWPKLEAHLKPLQTDLQIVYILYGSPMCLISRSPVQEVVGLQAELVQERAQHQALWDKWRLESDKLYEEAMAAKAGLEVQLGESQNSASQWQVPSICVSTDNV